VTATYLTPQQVEQLLQPINPRRVSVLDGLSHVEAYEIRAHLNRIFGFGLWSEELLELVELFALPTETKNKKPAINVAYRATVRLTVRTADGTVLGPYTEAAVGGSIMPDFKRADAYDMAIKTAESQALKRCAVNLGDQFGLSLYRNGSKDAVVIATLVGLPEKTKGDDGVKPASVDAVAPDAVPEHRPDPEPPAAPEQQVSAEAQALADLAPKMPTVEDLKTGVYDQAKGHNLLRASVADPISGEIVPLSSVIANAKGRLVQQAEAGAA
jgi:hypothetical protein